MDIITLKRKATEVAIKHVFCGIENDETLLEYVQFYENGFQMDGDDDTIPTGNPVWEPFEHFDEDELYTVVTDLINTIIDTFTEPVLN